MEAVIFLGGVSTGIAAMFLYALLLRIIAPWLRCFLSGAPISILSLIGMRLRGNPVKLLVDAHIALAHSGKPVSFKISELEAKYMANPNKFFTSQDLVNVMLDEHSQRNQ